MEKGSKISNIIKSTAVKHIDDAEVMLFGSRASGKADVDSDYDILIITSQKLSSEVKMFLRTKIRKELLEQGIRSDILIQNRGEIQKKKKLPGHLIRHILKEAIVL
ncbi:MAG: nucleotidyltransferase domain-containing protein [bacterium]